MLLAAGKVRALLVASFVVASVVAVALCGTVRHPSASERSRRKGGELRSRLRANIIAKAQILVDAEVHVDGSKVPWCDLLNDSSLDGATWSQPVQTQGRITGSVLLPPSQCALINDAAAHDLVRHHLRNRSLAVIGDSVARFVFWALASIICEVCAAQCEPTELLLRRNELF